MLSIVRRMVRSKLMLVVIGLLIVGLAGMGLPDMFSSAEPRGMISAGDRFIVKRDVDQRVDTYIRNVREAEGRTLSRQDAAQSGIIQQVLQAMMNETALLSFADKEKIEATRFAVTEMVANAPRFKNAVTGEFDEEAFQLFARQQGQTVKQLETGIKESFTREYLVNSLSTGLHTPDALGKVWMTAQSEQREFSYVNIPSDAGGDIADPTDEQLQAFYEDNQSSFRQPERKAVTILSIAPSDFVGAVEVAEEDLRSEYELRIKEFSSDETRALKEFSSPNRRLVQQAVDEIGAGGNPDEVLTGLSELIVTTRIVSQSDIQDEEYGKTAFGVAEGTHFGAYELEEGNWTGVIVETVYAGTPTPFENVSDQIKSEIATLEAEKIFETKQEEFFDLVGGGFDLEEAAEALQVPLMSFDSIDQQGRTENNHLLGSVVFRPDAMETLGQLSFDGEVSDILDDVADGLYVIRLDKLEESFIPPLADVKEIATNAYKLYEASQGAQNLADKVLARAQELNDLSQAAEENDLLFVKSETKLTRREIPEGISRAMAFQLFSTQKGEYAIANEQDGGRTVVFLSDITNLEPDMLDVLATSGKRAISESLESDVQMAFLEAVLAESEVEQNGKAITEYIQTMSGE